ncbi:MULTISPECIES: YgdB family protein [Rahnella]|uniref:YgdB family protein n=1 Tax=Rahnella TaxID=34037 RepID=UPI003D2DD27B
MTAAEMRNSVRQRGSTMILSIIVMMGLGLIALNSLQQQLSAGLALTSNQHRYVIAWENAASALAWGIRQSWKDSSEPFWQCRNVAAGIIASGTGRVCVRPSLRQDIFLFRGEGRMAEGNESVMQYQQVSVKKQASGEVIFSPLKQGWLDFCPEADEQVCNE